MVSGAGSLWRKYLSCSYLWFCRRSLPLWNRLWMEPFYRYSLPLPSASFCISLSPLKIKGRPHCLTIRTSLAEDSTAVRIAIADTGSGIAPDIQSKIFDPFFTTKSVGKGTGIGLSISYQIVVEQHGGMLTCSNRADQGAEFVIQLSVRQG